MFEDHKSEKYTARFPICWNDTWKLMFAFVLSLAWSPVNKTYMLCVIYHDKRNPQHQIISHLIATILVIIFWDILMFDKIFVSPQVKRIVIISNKHGIYELPHELPNDLRLRKLGNIKKISKLHRIIARRSVFLLKLNFCQC